MMSLKKAEAAKLSVNPDSEKHFPCSLVNLFYCNSLTLALSRTKADCQEHILAGQILESTWISLGLPTQCSYSKVKGAAGQRKQTAEYNTEERDREEYNQKDMLTLTKRLTLVQSVMQVIALQMLEIKLFWEERKTTLHLSITKLKKTDFKKKPPSCRHQTRGYTLLAFGSQQEQFPSSYSLYHSECHKMFHNAYELSQVKVHSLQMYCQKK